MKKQVGMKLAELVGELERLAESVWLADEPETASGVSASELCDLMGSLGIAIDDMKSRAKVRHDAALEAYWADKAREFAKTSPEGEHAVRTVDENMAISRAAVGIDAKLREFLRLLEAFALEFFHLVGRLFQSRFEDGDITFESGDLVSCKKHAEALKRLAGAIEEFEHGDYAVYDFHAASIAYSNFLRTGEL